MWRQSAGSPSLFLKIIIALEIHSHHPLGLCFCFTVLVPLWTQNIIRFSPDSADQMAISRKDDLILICSINLLLPTTLAWVGLKASMWWILERNGSGRAWQCLQRRRCGIITVLCQERAKMRKWHDGVCGAAVESFCTYKLLIMRAGRSVSEVHSLPC
ncbi:hypothetical protein BKA70DRAFT_92963 [Coprinopsis sp. MPI-PUGE-AT-0042]|nr:hypothetical protein BKA70DRAFT_92963 [Coprinopsis sp. MPI-PUGE-AT-0042]